MKGWNEMMILWFLVDLDDLQRYLVMGMVSQKHNGRQLTLLLPLLVVSYDSSMTLGVGDSKG
jgi:hypothetical protein